MTLYNKINSDISAWCPIKTSVWSLDNEPLPSQHQSGAQLWQHVQLDDFVTSQSDDVPVLLQCE